MTERVDFYVLGGASAAQRQAFACRLTEKAYLHDLRVVIWSAGEAEAAALDELLWTFSERSFIPHRLRTAAQPLDPGTPVHLTLELDGIDGAGLLVNLTDRLPTGLERFQRIAEVLDADGERRRLGRERFKSYRELALEPHTHQLDPAAESAP